MKYTITVFISLVFFLFVSIGLAALDLETVLAGIPDEAIAALKADGVVYRQDRNHRGTILLPDISMAGEARRRLDSIEPDVYAEALYLIPYTRGQNSIDLDFYNLTRKVSTLPEVEYLSDRKDEVVPLYENAYAVEDMKKKRQIDDPFVNSIPASDTVLMLMKEDGLAKVYYQVDYLYDGENLGFFLRNLTPLRSILKVVDRENMHINMIFIPVDEGFLVYGSCEVQLNNANTVFKMMDPYSGFYRRLYAMFSWIDNSMHNTQRSTAIGEALDY